MSDEATTTELPLSLVGLDHRTADLDLRERIACASSESETRMVELLAQPAIAEAVILSTCNRTELYLRPNHRDSAWRTGLEQIFERQAPEIVQQGRFYVRHGSAAARHLMAVAAGAESMVLGEPEIQGQVKEAVETASRIGASGDFLEHVFHAANQAAKRVRRETAIGAGAVSLGSAVIDLATNVFPNLRGRRVLLLGAGDTARLVARSLDGHGLARLWVANRSPERLAELRQELPFVDSLSLERVRDTLTDVDLVVAATASERPLLHRDEMAAAVRRRGDRTLLVVDLGVPRNVDPACDELPGVFLYPIDALEGLIDRNLDLRRAELGRVEAILDEELLALQSWHRNRRAEPVVAALQRRAEQIRRQELERVWDRFPDACHEDLERLTRSLIRKILHHPSTVLRRPDRELGPARLELARHLFQLDDDDG